MQLGDAGADHLGMSLRTKLIVAALLVAGYALVLAPAFLLR